MFVVTKSEFHTVLAQVWSALEQLSQKESLDMADLTTALADLDTLLSDVETEIATLQREVQAGNPAAIQQVADTLESKIAAARAALANAPAPGGTTTPPSGGGTGTPVGDPGTPVGTEPTQGA